MASTRFSIALFACLASAAAVAGPPMGVLNVEIELPAEGALFTSLDGEIEVLGGASIFGGVKHLDLILVLDSSKSLLKTDRGDHRVRGAVELVRRLPTRSDIQLGVVEFDRDAQLVQPLTADRRSVERAIRGLDRKGGSDIAAGIRAALEGFRKGARPGSSRVMLLFTDGRSDEEPALAATREAAAAGVAIHTLVLGSSQSAAELLATIARDTGGTSLIVEDPTKLPEAFLNLRTTGVDRVTLSVNGGPEQPMEFFGGSFNTRLKLVPGENRLVATATSLDGRTRSAVRTVRVADEITLSIETPEMGALFEGATHDARVAGVATLFADATPEQLDALPDHGVRQVLLRVGDGPAVPATLEGDRFEADVTLTEGENRILATATTADGRVADTAVTVTLRPPACAGLEVRALREGQPALSISDRAVEIVVDASNSMWARMQGRSKHEVARETLDTALSALPEDLELALRVYGHQHAREQRNCTDSELLVPFGASSRERVREAIASYKPRGQTPLGYSLEQVAADFGSYAGERAVVLVTDGIESCGGDPVAAARSLREQGGAAVHVIGFGIGGEDEDAASLRAIAEASGGRFITAGSAEELRDALSVSVGTAFRVSRDGEVVAESTLGAAPLPLPAGEYTVALESRPPRELPVALTSQEATTLVLDRTGSGVRAESMNLPLAYRSCEDAGVAGLAPGQPGPARAGDQ